MSFRYSILKGCNLDCNCTSLFQCFKLIMTRFWVVYVENISLLHTSLGNSSLLLSASCNIGTLPWNKHIGTVSNVFLSFISLLQNHKCFGDTPIWQSKVIITMKPSWWPQDWFYFWRIELKTLASLKPIIIFLSLTEDLQKYLIYASNLYTRRYTWYYNYY